MGAKLTQRPHVLTSLAREGSKRVFHNPGFTAPLAADEPDKPPHPNFTAVRIHQGLPHFQPDRNRIVTTGTFDGVHLGHRALLDWMTEEARRQDAETVVLTFDPHPRQVLFGENSGLQLLQSLGQRAECLAQTGLDHLVVQHFDRTFSRLKPSEFVREVLVDGLGTTTIVVGHDHRFGAGREGDVELLRACGETYGFDVMHIPAHIEGELTVSSTKVRQRVDEGDLDGARDLLGRHHAWRGKVVEGDGRGRTLGFRTANLSACEPSQLLPPEGVYAARARMVQGSLSDDVAPETPEATQWEAMVHIGPRPTFEANTGQRHVEAHLFTEGSPDLYGREVELSFGSHLRDIRKFEDRDALILQLEQDEMAARRVLGND